MDSYNPPITGPTITQEQVNVNRTQRLVNWKENMKDDHTFSAKILYLIYYLSQVTWQKN